MDHFPIFVKLTDQTVLVVGAGPVAARKVGLLMSSGARVAVVAPAAEAGLRELASRRQLTWHAREFIDDDVSGARLVFAATDSAAVNARVAEICRSREIPVNVVDQPALGSFIMPSIVDRSPVLAAISTGGSAPTLARLLRGRLEAAIPAAFGQLAALAREYREQVKAVIAHPTARRRFWEQAFDGEVAELTFAGREADARERLEQMLHCPAPRSLGEVYLVGAGPGDPDLLTFRAMRLMQRAEVVLYDRLVSEPVLDLVRRDAELVYVGKRRGNHAMHQRAINEQLVELAATGRRVLRLKGGDPFVFGRGGEEIDTLAERGIPFQVVPGITAASGCAAYAGIPLTHRDHAQSCVFVAGHLQDGTVNLNWPALAHPGQTLVFYMGLVGLPIICEKLVEHGLGSDTPAALVQRGTTPQQRVLTSTLAQLPALVERERPRAPTLLMVGSVVELHGKLGWFQPDRPESGHLTTGPQRI
ncbi:MAG: siroheme synthase CysG [Pseudomonadota bacterium]